MFRCESLELPDWRTSSYVTEFRYTNNWLAEKAKFRKTGQASPNHQYMGNRRTICGYYVVGGVQHLLEGKLQFLLDISPVGKARSVAKRVHFSREMCIKYTRETLPSETCNTLDILLGKR